MSARANLKDTLKRVSASLGYDIHRRDLAHPTRRASAMQSRGVDLVFDIGANRGQYVSMLREFGYSGTIVSYEPIPFEFAALKRGRRGDSHWRGKEVAVGATQGKVELHVSDSTVLSSVLPTRRELSDSILAAATASVIEVPIVTIDDE